MILWTLSGYSDPEGEFTSGEIVCSIERSEDGYRLLVEHDGEIQLPESHRDGLPFAGRRKPSEQSYSAGGVTE